MPLLPEMPLGEHVVEDYATLGLTLKRHPLAFLRPELRREGLVTAADLAVLPVGRRLAIAGLVLIRQRPGSANGVVFITIEDETGVANLIVWPATSNASAVRRSARPCSTAAAGCSVRRALSILSPRICATGRRVSTCCASVGPSHCRRASLAIVSPAETGATS